MTTRTDDAIRVGTRRSRLARAQTAEVRRLIEDALGIPTEEVLVTSRGDADPTRPLAAMVRDGPGLFTRALEDALLNGEVDVVVHSLKDMPLKTPEEIPIVAVPARADARDVLVVREDAHDATRIPLPVKAGARVGTSAPRRQSQLAAADPEAVAVDVRGNVETRLSLIGKDVVDAVLLAKAGLDRAGLDAPDGCRVVPLPTDAWPTCPGQGVLAVQARADDELAAALHEVLDDPEARAMAMAERAILGALGGGCGIPLGATARREGDAWHMDATLSPGNWWRDAALRRATVAAPDPGMLAEAVNQQLKAPAPPATRAPDATTLAGTRVLVTFDEETAAPWLAVLRAAGADAAAWPLTRHTALPVKPLPPRIRQAVADAQWVVVSSARGVRGAEAVHAAGATGARYGAVGPATARALRHAGLPVHLVSPDGTAKGLARVIAGWTEPAGPVIAPGARDPLPDLEEDLTAAGFEVVQWPVYRTRPVDAAPEVPLDAVDALVVTAPSAARALPEDVVADRLIALGPSTAKALTERGRHVDAVMPRRTPQALLETLAS